MVEFDATTVRKGSADRSMRLRTTGSRASCGYSFVEGVEYLVYSWVGSSVSLCSRTSPLAQTGDDLVEQRPGPVPTHDAATTTPVIPE